MDEYREERIHDLVAAHMHPHRMTREEGKGLIGEDATPPPCRHSCHRRRAATKKEARTGRIWARGSGLLLTDSTTVNSKEQQPRLLFTNSQAPLHPPLRPPAPTEKIPGRADDGGDERRTLNEGELL
jgi:hypothetical protein